MEVALGVVESMGRLLPSRGGSEPSLTVGCMAAADFLRV